MYAAAGNLLNSPYANSSLYQATTTTTVYENGTLVSQAIVGPGILSDEFIASQWAAAQPGGSIANQASTWISWSRDISISVIGPAPNDMPIDEATLQATLNYDATIFTSSDGKQSYFNNAPWDSHGSADDYRIYQLANMLTDPGSPCDELDDMSYISGGMSAAFLATGNEAMSGVTGTISFGAATAERALGCSSQ
jgi:hypothetical protein